MSEFSDNAKEAIEKAPDYFMWWYTVKSVGLGAAIGVIGYQLGKASRKKNRRRRRR